MKTFLPKLIPPLLAMLCLDAAAVTLYVDLNSPNPTPPYTSWPTAATNIQDAMDAAVAGDVVLVTNGVYNSGGRVVFGLMTNRVVVDKAVTVLSVNGPQFTIIQGNPAIGSSAVRCVYLTNFASLSGFTLTSGATASTGDYDKERSGGAAWGQSTNAVITNCIISGNAAYFSAGGIYQASIINSTISANSATRGGGVDASILTDCILAGNTAGTSSLNYPWGGGAYSSTLYSCTLTNNRGRQGGAGAAFCTLYDCDISKNSANSGSGGIPGGYGGGTTACVLSNCTLTANIAKGNGGGANGGALYNCTISGNSAGIFGGGVHGGTAKFCVITGNVATEGGGAYGAPLSDCIVSANRANKGGGSSNGELVNCVITGNEGSYDGSGAGTFADYLSNCIIYFNAPGGNYAPGSVFNYCCTTPAPTGGAGNFTNAPLFVNAAAGDYRPQSNSPCINAGLNTLVVNAVDLGGSPRIAGGTVDVGAYEFQSPSSVLSYAWAQQNGLPTNGSADFTDADGDGMNNYGEWRSDTIPTNASSVLRIVSTTTSPTGAQVSWQSVATRNYWLERATNLGAAPAFQTIATNLAGTVGTKTFMDTSATEGGPYFYRVGVQ